MRKEKQSLFYDRVTVKPARSGLIVLDPNTGRALPEEGDEVLRTSYWRRAINAGDVVIVPQPSKTSKK